MGQRTLSLPQRSGLLGEPVLFEAISKLVAGVNMALTIQSLPAAPISASGMISVSNPVVRVTGPGVIRQIAPVDFNVPIFLIALHGTVTLQTGGNIAAGADIAQNTICGLVYDQVLQQWWPLSGGGQGSWQMLLASASISSTGATVNVPDGYQGVAVTPDTTGRSISYITKTPASYANGDVVWIENVDPTVSFDVNENPAVNGTRIPGGAALTLGPRRTAQFHYSAGVWWQVTTV